MEVGKSLAGECQKEPGTFSSRWRRKQWYYGVVNIRTM